MTTFSYLANMNFKFLLVVLMGYFVNADSAFAMAKNVNCIYGGPILIKGYDLGKEVSIWEVFKAYDGCQKAAISEVVQYCSKNPGKYYGTAWAITFDDSSLKRRTYGWVQGFGHCGNPVGICIDRDGRGKVESIPGNDFVVPSVSRTAPGC